MFNNSIIFLMITLVIPGVVFAASERKRDNVEPKLVSGISIVGNDETPKTLYLVPWRDSDDQDGMNVDPGNFEEELQPINKDDFVRELRFYENINPN